MFLAWAIAVLGVLAAHWLRRRVRTGERYQPWAWLLPALIVLVLMGLHAGDLESGRDGNPVLIVIASDVSLSMGTRPEPGKHPATGTRLDRARRALMPLLRELDASTSPVMAAVTAFTSTSETLLAWSDEPPQVREAIEYVLAPGLLTEPGSDLGAALQGALPLFDSLPAADGEEESEKYLILVSDGEQNVHVADTAEALAGLRDEGVRIVALHVGLADVPEGLPLYDSAGRFTGFDEVGGQIVSVPDPAAMAALVGQDASAGLFVKGEEAVAAQAMLDYMGVRIAGSESAPWRTGLILLLWLLVMAAMVRYV